MYELLSGNCLDVLRTLPEASVQCCITSPPYWGLRNYGAEGQIGLEDTIADHLQALVQVFREVRRVLHPQGVLWVNYGNMYANDGGNGRSQRHAGRGEALDGLAGLQTAQDLGGDTAVAGTKATADALAAGQLAVHPDRAAAEGVALPFSGVWAITYVSAVRVEHGEAII